MSYCTRCGSTHRAGQCLRPRRTPDIRPLVVQNITKRLTEMGVPDAAVRAEELLDRADEIWADLTQESDTPSDL